MTTAMAEAMTAGVWFEFRDEQGHTVAQAVYADWKGRPLPGVGDLVCCPLATGNVAPPRRVRGRVLERHFDLQHDDQGQLCVWARITVTTALRKRKRRSARQAVDSSFSAN